MTLRSSCSRSFHNNPRFTRVVMTGQAAVKDRVLKPILLVTIPHPCMKCLWNPSIEASERGHMCVSLFRYCSQELHRDDEFVARGGIHSRNLCLGLPKWLRRIPRGLPQRPIIDVTRSCEVVAPTRGTPCFRYYVLCKYAMKHACNEDGLGHELSHSQVQSRIRLLRDIPATGGKRCG